MNIEQIATRVTDRPHPEPGDVAIDHPYRTRWWLPIIGPTATCALTHLTTDTMTSDWQLTSASELAVSLGLGKGTATNSPLIRSLLRLTRFGFGHFDPPPLRRGASHREGGYPDYALLVRFAAFTAPSTCRALRVSRRSQRAPVPCDRCEA